MNERIKELYKQAARQDYFPRDTEEVYMSAKDLEKFAELIVKECLQITLKSSSVPNKSAVAIAEAERILHKIKEHFGVEE